MRIVEMMADLVEQLTKRRELRFDVDSDAPNREHRSIASAWLIDQPRDVQDDVVPNDVLHHREEKGVP